MTDDHNRPSQPPSPQPQAPARQSRPPRRNRPRFFGQFLLAEGYITAPQLLAALEYQEQFNARLGEYAVALGLLTLFDAQQIHARQAEKDLLFGQAALELQLLTKEQLRQVMAAQRNDHVLLGEALCKLGYMTDEALAGALFDLANTPESDPSQLINLPTDVPARDVVEKAFYLTHKLLPRLWDLQNKPEQAQILTGTLLLSDRNAMVTLRGDTTFRAYLGVPHAIAERAVRVVNGNATPTDAECDEAVADMLATICNNLHVTLASEGIALSHTEPSPAEFKTALGATTAVLVPFVTHQGQVILAVSY